MSQLTEFLKQGVTGQEMSSSALLPVTLVINGSTFSAAGGAFRDVPRSLDEGGFILARRIKVRVLQSALDAASVVVRPGATDCTVNGVECKIMEQAQTVADPAVTLTCEAV